MNTRYVDPDADVGGNGTTQALTGATCAYVSLNVWEAARQASLSEPEQVVCGSADASHTADTTKLDLTGWTTSAANYIQITTDSGSRASTTWSDSKYRYSVTDAFPVYLREDYIQLDGVQFYASAAAASQCFLGLIDRAAESTLSISNCCFRGHGNASYVCSFLDVISGNAGTLYAWNSLFYGWGANASSYILLADSITAYFYSCTGIWASGTTAGIRNVAATSITCKNCYSGGNAAGRDYFGTITKTTCASADTTGSAGLQSIAINTDNFTNVSAGTEDFSLPSGSALIDVGTDTSGDAAPLDFTDDIDGTARGATWDVGAHEYAASGVSGSLDVTLAALTAAGAGAVAVAGSASVTLGALTAAGTGTVAVQGGLATALGALTLAGTGTIGVAGQAALTLAALTAAGAGTVAVAGQAALALASVAVGAAGTVSVSGALSTTLGALTVTAAAAVAVTGTASVTLGALSVSASGTVAVAGVAAMPLAALTLAGTGTVAVTGTATLSLGLVTLTGLGTVAVTGSADLALEALALTAQAITAGIAGTLDVTLAPLAVLGTLIVWSPSPHATLTVTAAPILRVPRDVALTVPRECRTLLVPRGVSL